jgi:hypothetical protein
MEETPKKENKRTWEDYIPFLSVMIGAAVFVGGTILAMVVYDSQNGSYDVLDQFFSELGTRYLYQDPVGINNYPADDPRIFNYTLVLSGFLMMPFFPLTWRQMDNLSKSSRWGFRLAVVFGTLSAPALIGVGLIDLSVRHFSLLTNHYTWAFLLYSLITLALITWAFGLLRADEGLPYKKHSTHIGTEIIIALAIAVLMVASLVYHVVIALENQTLAVEQPEVQESSSLDWFPIEVFQKLMAYLFFIYFFFVGRKLMNPDYDNTPSYYKT